MPVKAVAARFSADPHRRSMIAKVHIAKQQLALCDDDYVAVVLRVTGHASSADCTNRQLEELLKEFTRLGFKAVAKPKAQRAADHPAALKARALWISLHHLGAIDNPSEKALEAFAKRQLGCARLQWADQSLAYKLIEALKAIGTRHGWDANLDGVAPHAQVVVLKRRLVEALFVKLKAAQLVPDDWSVSRAARTFGGTEVQSVMLATATELETIAREFGRTLRQPAARIIPIGEARR